MNRIVVAMALLFLSGALISGGWSVLPIKDYEAKAPSLSCPVVDYTRADGYYSGDAHVFSDNSKGSNSVDEIASKAEDIGLSWVAITDNGTGDHIAQCRAVTTSSFVCVPGQEVKVKEGTVLGLGINYAVEHTWNTSLSEILPQFNSQGALVVLSHPFSATGPYNPDGEYDFDAIEVWYGESDFSYPDEKAIDYWDGLLNNGKHITAIGGSGTRNISSSEYNPVGPKLGQPRNHLIMDSLSENSILDAIRTGHNIITDGVPLTLSVISDAGEYGPGDEMGITQGETAEVTVDVSTKVEKPSVLKVIVNGEAVKEENIAKPGEVDLSFRTNVTGGDWLRCEVRPITTAYGSYISTTGFAFSNPVWFTPVEPDYPPTAVIHANRTNVYVNEPISFDGSASSDDGTIKSYHWSFGDGNSATGVTTEHSYGRAGTYTVKLTVTDNADQTGTATAVIKVSEVPQSDEEDNSSSENDTGEEDTNDTGDDTGEDTGTDETPPQEEPVQNNSESSDTGDTDEGGDTGSEEQPTEDTSDGQTLSDTGEGTDTDDDSGDKASSTPGYELFIYFISLLSSIWITFMRKKEAGKDTK